MYRIIYEKQAVKMLGKMPANWAERIQQKIQEVAQDPYRVIANATKLQGRDGYRLRVGDWRIIYTIEDDNILILVLDIASRGSIY